MNKTSVYARNHPLFWLDVEIVGEQTLVDIVQWFGLCEQSWPLFFQAEGSFETNTDNKILNQNLLSFRVLSKNPELKIIPFPLLKCVARAFCSHRKHVPVKGCNDSAANFTSFAIGRDSAGFLDANTAWLCEHTLSINSNILKKEKLEMLENVHRLDLAELFLLTKKNEKFNFVVGFHAFALQRALDYEKNERGVLEAKEKNLEISMMEKKADQDSVPF